LKNWLRRPLHSCWLVAALSFGFAAGDGLAILPWVDGFAWPIWPICAALLALAGFLNRKIWAAGLILIAGILLGLWRGTLQRVDLTSYQPFINQTVNLTGTVAEDPDVDAGAVKLRLKNVSLQSENYEARDLPGQIWASALGSKIPRRGDMISLSGKLKSGFGTFPASISYANLNKIQSFAGRDPARDLRDSFGDKLRAVIAEPESDLGMGILAGQKTALPTDLTAAFMAASLTHIVVASGYNLTILIRFARRLFAKISRRAALFGGLLLALGFSLVTGWSPSMTRAALVAGLSLIAWFYGRRFHPLVLISVVAALTILANPMYPWGDAGWYMSFFSFAGVLLLAPLLKDYFWGNEKVLKIPLTGKIWAKFRRRYFAKKNFVQPAPRQPKFTIRQILLETLSAQLLAAPIIALFLGQFSPYGLIANLLVLPIVPLTMLLTFVAGIGGWLLPHLGWIAAPARWLLHYIIWISQKVAALPGAAQSVKFGGGCFALTILVLVLIIFYIKRRTRHNWLGDSVVE
jgi:competence protein ComEC